MFRKAPAAVMTAAHYVMLAVIVGATFWSAFGEFGHILLEGHPPGLKDILLLFIYLEILAMVGVYFNTHHLPVRFLIYIAITAIMRVLVVDTKTMSVDMILGLSASVLVLALAVLVIKFGSARFPGRPSVD